MSGDRGSRPTRGSPLRFEHLEGRAMLAGDTITQWTFEGDVTTPETGVGTALLIGGTTSTFAAGNGGGRGWNTSAYASQSTASGVRGVEFLFSTEGYENLEFSFDHRSSATGSRWAQVDYTVDGTDWVRRRPRSRWCPTASAGWRPSRSRRSRRRRAPASRSRASWPRSRSTR